MPLLADTIAKLIRCDGVSLASASAGRMVVQDPTRTPCNLCHQSKTRFTDGSSLCGCPLPLGTFEMNGAIWQVEALKDFNSQQVQAHKPDQPKLGALLVPYEEAMKRMKGEWTDVLTQAQAERLDWLIEECAEVIQAATKIKRHGYSSRNPLMPDSLNNLEHLQKEIGHVRCAIFVMLNAGDVSDGLIGISVANKLDSYKKWMHHQ